MVSRQMDQGNFRGMPPQQQQPMQQQQPESTSVIDQYSNFDGTYNSARDLRVEGQVKGTIVCKGTLHVAQGATVKASVEAEAISVAGELEGEINCRGRLELLQTGRVTGQISTQSLVIHEGAVYEGDLEMGGSAGRTRRSRVAERTTTSDDSATTPDSPGIEAESTQESTAAESAPSTESEAPASRPSSFIRRFGTTDTSASAPEATEE